MSLVHAPHNSSAQQSAQPDPYRWTLLVGVWMIYACFGLTAAGVAPLVNILISELNISLSLMGAILGGWPAVYIVAAIPAGAVLDRIGLRWALFGAALLIGLSGILRGLAFDGLSLFAAVAVFGIGGPLVSTGAPKLISQCFCESERASAIGIYMTGPAIGAIVALSLTNSVMMPLTGDSWRLTLAAYGVLSILLGGLWLWLARPRVAPNLAFRASAKRRFDWSVYPALLRVRQVRWVMCLAVGVFLVNHGLNNWVPEILRRGGMSASSAGFWASVPLVIGIAGALTIPRLAVPHRRIALFIVLCLCAAVATRLIASSQLGIVVVALMFQGVARSAMMPIAMLLLMEAKGVGQENMGAAGGLFFTAAEIGGVLGPLSLGVIADLTGGFDLALWMLSLLCVAMAVIALFVRDRQGGSSP